MHKAYLRSILTQRTAHLLQCRSRVAVRWHTIRSVLNPQYHIMGTLQTDSFVSTGACAGQFTSCLSQCAKARGQSEGFVQRSVTAEVILCKL